MDHYQYSQTHDVFVELFYAPRSSLDNPSLRSTIPALGQRSFCVMDDDGDMDGVSGYWAEDELKGEVGFLPEFEDDLLGFLMTPRRHGCPNLLRAVA